MKAKRELTKQEKKDMTMKYEIAEGLMGRRKAEARAREKACNPNAGKI